MARTPKLASFSTREIASASFECTVLLLTQTHVSSYGLNQSCAMLLLIAAGNSRLALSDASPTATNGNGGAVGFAYGVRSSFSVADHAKSLFFEHGGRPVAIDRGGYACEFPPPAFSAPPPAKD